MLSPMQRNMEKARKEQAATNVETQHNQENTSAIQSTAENYSEFEVLVNVVDKDVTALGSLAKQDRDPMRKTLIEKYMGHIDAYIEAAKEYANPVLVYMIIWLFDLGRIADASKLGLLAIVQKQAMPKGFKRDLTTFVFDEVMKWAEKEHKAGRSPNPYFKNYLELLGAHSLPDIVVMKFYKLAGNMAFDENNMLDAEKYYLLAIEADSEHAKVDTKLAKAKKYLAENKPATSGDKNAAV